MSRRAMGQASTNLAPRSGSSATNNLPPIQFHQVHGDNIRISGDGSVARRVESFCKGVAFSSRPIKVNEKVCIKFLEVSNNWSGVIRFGFTSNDPSNLRYSLPKYACPDLTSKPGYWAKALGERFAERDNILYYYVTHMGDVYFGINGEEKGIFLSGIETRGPLWALFDVYGNSTGIELVDHRAPLNNSRRAALNGTNDVGPELENQILPSFHSLCIQNANQRNVVVARGGGGEEGDVGITGDGGEIGPNQTDLNRTSLCNQTGCELQPLIFHRTRGHNIRMSNDRSVATRSDTEFCLGYVFTSRPVILGEKIIIKVLATENMYAGALAFGLTSCDPSTLTSSDLPEDSNSLLDRPEYWVVQKNVANNPKRGDELAFSVSATGEVLFWKNGNQPTVFMHVDQTLELWAFFDVYGSTQKVRLLGSIVDHNRDATPWHRVLDDGNRRLIRSLHNGETSQVVNGIQQNLPALQNGQSNRQTHRHCCPPDSATPANPITDVVQFQQGMGGGTVLVVNLPPAHSNFINHQQHPPPRRAHSRTFVSTSVDSQNSHSNGFGSGTLVSNTFLEPIPSPPAPPVTNPVPRPASGTGPTGATTNSECSICYERSIDSVLYMCGHMCMCYECAVQQWRGKGGGHCPLCRAVIRDVIRTYKS